MPFVDLCFEDIWCVKDLRGTLSKYSQSGTAELRVG